MGDGRREVVTVGLRVVVTDGRSVGGQGCRGAGRRVRRGRGEAGRGRARAGYEDGSNKADGGDVSGPATRRRWEKRSVSVGGSVSNIHTTRPWAV